ncbi:MAG: hypothetical protein AAF889_12425 [Cyanobacteria bacterium P01_D01_bin.73]
MGYRRRILGCIGAIALGVGLGSCDWWQAQEESSPESVEAIAPPSPVASPTASPSPTPAKGHRYQSPKGKASVLFPEKPKADVNQIETPNGKTEIFLARYADNKQGRVYLFSHNAIPVPKNSYLDIEKALNNSRDSLAQGISATVTSEVKLRLNGFRGREIRLTRPGQFAAKARVFYADGVLYQAVVGAEDAKLDDEAVMTFLKSIQLKKSASK